MFLQGSGTVTFAPGSGQTQTVSNAIADEAGNGGSAGNKWTLSKTGAGTLTLSAANSYSGGTNVTGGTVSISSDANLGNGGTVALGDGTGIDFTAGGTYSHDITVAGDPTFTVGTGLTVTQSGQIADGATPGDVEVKGGGTLVLSNALNSYSGGTTVTEGSILSIGAGGALGDVAGGLTLGDATTGGTLATTVGFTTARDISLGAGGGTIDTASGVTTELSGDLGGAGDLTKSGLGTLVLSGTNSHTGATTVDAGTLQGTTATLTGAITDNANVTFDQSTAGTYGGVLSGSGSLTKIGAGTLTLTGANGYGGGTHLDGGTLSISSDANLGNGGELQMAAGTTLDVTAGGSYTHDITVEGDPFFNIAAGQTMTQSGVISDGSSAGTIEVTGGGTLALTNTNTYSGGTTVTENSTVSIAADGALGTGGLTLGDATTGGTLALTGSLATPLGITLDAGGGTIDTSSGAPSFLFGVITGPGRLTKTGAGTLILSGANNYAGGTTVSGGTLEGTTASLQGDILDNANVTFAQNTIGTYSGTITGSGGVTKNIGGTVTFTGANGYTGSTEVDEGTLQLALGGSLASTTALTVNGGFFDLENGGQTVGRLSGAAAPSSSAMATSPWTRPGARSSKASSPARAASSSKAAASWRCTMRATTMAAARR